MPFQCRTFDVVNGMHRTPYPNRMAFDCWLVARGIEFYFVNRFVQLQVLLKSLISSTSAATQSCRRGNRGSGTSDGNIAPAAVTTNYCHHLAFTAEHTNSFKWLFMLIFIDKNDSFQPDEQHPIGGEDECHTYGLWFRVSEQIKYRLGERGVVHATRNWRKNRRKIEITPRPRGNARCPTWLYTFWMPYIRLRVCLGI